MKVAFRNKKVMVTGGLGFIGSNLVHKLVDLGAEVTIVDSLIPECGGNPFNVEDIKKKVRIENVDLREKAKIEDLVKNQDIIFNLAGKVSHIDSVEKPGEDFELNCRAHLFLLEACRKNNPEVKILYAGTRGEYGRANRLPVDEKCFLRPIDINGLNKMVGEWYHLLYYKIHGMRTASLRLTNTYGPRHLMTHGRQGFLNYFLRLAMDDEEIEIFGDGRQLRDFNYVDDVVEAFLLAATSDRAEGEVFNLGSGRPISLLEVTELLLRITGKGSYKHVPFPEELKAIDIGDYYADFGKIKKTLGWEPTIDLEEGLKRTGDFYKKNKKHYW